MRPKIFSSYAELEHSVHMSIPDCYPAGMATVLANDILEKGDAMIKDNSFLGQIQQLTEVHKQRLKEERMQKQMHDLLIEEYEKDEADRRFGENLEWCIQSIRESIEKRAKQGKHKYTYELGKETEKEKRVAELITKSFTDFSPKIRTEVIDCDDWQDHFYEIKFGEVSYWKETHLRIDFSW